MEAQVAACIQSQPAPPGLYDELAQLPATGFWLVSSGGTSVPLDRQGVRSIENFSTGRRGAELTEALLAAGKTVVFLYRDNSELPYIRGFRSAAQEIISAQYEPDHFASLLHQIREAVTTRRLILVPFITLGDYLTALLQLTTLTTCRAAVLAAAASDFHLSADELPQHKIDSRQASVFELKLRPVPKILGIVRERLKKIGAKLITFKLETDDAVLKSKMRQAMDSYHPDLILGNMLPTRYEKALILTAGAEDFVEVQATAETTISQAMYQCILQLPAAL